MRNDSALPAVLRRFWLWSATLTALSVAYTVWNARHRGLDAPYGLVVRWGDAKWNDLLVFRPGFLHFRTPEFWSSFVYPFTYPAASGVVFGLLYKLAHPVRGYLLLLGAALAVATGWMARQLRKRGVGGMQAWSFTVCTVATMWPLWVLIDTANVEGVVVLVLGCGVLAVWRERWLLGATLIGVAGAMKIFPLVMLALLLSKRRYREFGLGLAVAAATTVCSLALLGPNVVEAQRHVDAGLEYVKQNIMFSLLPFAPAFDHSLWIPVRFGAVFVDRLAHGGDGGALRTAAVLRISFAVYLCATAVLGLGLYALRIRGLPMLNQVVALTVCAVLLPPLSIDYTLVHLLLPFALLCAYAADMRRQREAVAGPGVMLGAMAVIFNAGTFLNRGHLYASEVRTVGLIVLLIAALRWPLTTAPAEVAG